MAGISVDRVIAPPADPTEAESGIGGRKMGAEWIVAAQPGSCRRSRVCQFQFTGNPGFEPNRKD